MARRNNTMRDMALSIGALVVAVLLFLGFQNGFSFSPGRPTGGDTPTADVDHGFNQAVDTAGFAVTSPVGVPGDWHPNSFTQNKAGDPDASTPAMVQGGWITPAGAYITLVESAGDIPATLVAQVGEAGSARSQVTVDNTIWTVTNGRRSESAWVRRSGDVTFLITGAAGEDDFRALAATVASA